MKKRIAALLLALAVMVTFMPAMALTAFADSTCTITYDGNGGFIEGTDPADPANFTDTQIIHGDDTLSIKKFIKPGFALDKWTDAVGNEYVDGQGYHKNEGDRTITAQWIYMVNLQFIDRGNCEAAFQNERTVEGLPMDNDEIVAPTDVEKTGYHLVGWFDENDKMWFDAEGNTSEVFPSQQELVLTAKWAPNNYTVKMYNGSKLVKSQKFTYDEAQNLNSYSVGSGKYFKYWKGADGNFYNNEELVSNLTADNDGTFKLTAVTKAHKFMAKAYTKDKDVSVYWNKAQNATLYKVYGNYCGKKVKYLGKTKGTKFVKKALAKGKSYKVLVKAYNGKKLVATSADLHLIVSGGNGVNADAKEVKAAASVELVKDATKTLAPKLTLFKAGRKALGTNHAAKFRFKTSDSKVATVNAKGVIKATGKGACYVYTYAANGVYCKTKVTVA